NDGGAGTMYIKAPSAVFGSLTIDNSGRNLLRTTELPALGIGVAAAGSTGAILVTDRSTDIGAWFIGHWVEIRDAAGAVRGIWRIASIDSANARKVTLAPNGGETISVQPGDRWRG